MKISFSLAALVAIGLGCFVYVFKDQRLLPALDDSRHEQGIDHSRRDLSDRFEHDSTGSQISIDSTSSTTVVQPQIEEEQDVTPRHLGQFLAVDEGDPSLAIIKPRYLGEYLEVDPGNVINDGGFPIHNGDYMDIEPTALVGDASDHKNIGELLEISSEGSFEISDNPIQTNIGVYLPVSIED